MTNESKSADDKAARFAEAASEETQRRLEVARGQIDRLQKELDASEAEVERLAETLDDWRRSATLAAGETCGDEKHCTCVGVLRKVLQEARDEVERLREELAAVQERVDLDVDEFRRIKAELDNLRIGVPPKDAEGAKILYALVSGLCDRAVTAGRQRVPLIEQRDQAEGEVDRLHAELAKAQHTTSGCCPQSEELAREVKRLRAERDRYHDALVARHGGEPVALLAELDEARAEVERLRGELKICQGHRAGHPDMCCGQCHDILEELRKQRDDAVALLRNAEPCDASETDAPNSTQWWEECLRLLIEIDEEDKP